MSSPLLPPPATPGATELALYAALAFVGLGGSALCSGLETSLYTLNHARLTLRAHEPGAPKVYPKLLHDIHQPDRPLAALLVANNLFNYFGVLGLSLALAAFGFSELMLVIANTVILSPLLLVFAESLPKDLMRQRADEIVPRLAPVLFTLERIATRGGLLPLLLVSARAAAKLTGGSSEASFEQAQRTRVAALLKEGAIHGLLTPRQSSLVDRALTFERATLADVQRPLDQLPTLNSADSPLDQALTLVRDKHPRALRLDAQGQPQDLVETESLLSPSADPAAPAAITLPPDITVREALRLLDVAARPAALVLDAAGRPAGFVTARDLIAPLTGPLAEG